MGASQRRTSYRLYLGVNRKLSTVGWIGSATVRVVNYTGNYAKANERAEKSRTKVRRRRGKRMGGHRSRGGKPRRSGSIRTSKSKRARSSRRESREQSWLEKRTALVLEKLERWEKSEKTKDCTSVPPIDIYRGLCDQVSRISSLGEPMSYSTLLKCVRSEMWNVMGQDITCSILPLEGSLSDALDGTNITIVYSNFFAPPPEFSRRNNTRRPRRDGERNPLACRCDVSYRGPTIVRFGELWQGCGLCGHSWQQKLIRSSGARKPPLWGSR